MLSTEVIDALRRVGATTVELAATRLELAGIEITQERLRLSRLIAAAAVALAGLGWGSTLAALALAAWLGPQAGAWWLGGAAALWLVIAIAAIVQCRQLVRGATPMLQDTLAQLRQDAAALAARP
jgi:uncharacterized membrane protein YqjE